MAGETPFGASFGDPRQYMGKSPLAEIGKGLKQGLTAYALKESGFTDYLNSLNKKPVDGAVPPVGSPVAVQPPQAAPMMPQAVQPFQPNVVVTPVPESEGPPADIGEQILNGTWTGFPSAPAGPTSLRNPTDFNPLAPDVSNQFAMSGNEYLQIPGYGKSQKIAGQFMGMG
jgi:hypothetical protein